MSFRSLLHRFAAIALVGATLTTASVQAQPMPADAPGGKDHPVLSRYAGSWLAAYEVNNYDEVAVATGVDFKTVNVAGKVTRLFYIAPAGKKPVEVQRNYEVALENAGAKLVNRCKVLECQAMFRPQQGQVEQRTFARGELMGVPATSFGTGDWNNWEDQIYWYGTLNSGGRNLHIVVHTGRPSNGTIAQRYLAATYVQIIEPKPMETGKVTVDANALAKGLQAEGKVALYGIYFDTGKAALKPESQPQLHEIGRLLRAQPALKVHVVGHTDNQGALDANLALSKARAQAVVDALVKGQKLDAKRLSPAGAASYAPVASNADEAGRSRNRRVEIVAQ
jgi:outer membrane protein OmpA-like peptidoglycan-associated protein